MNPELNRWPSTFVDQAVGTTSVAASHRNGTATVVAPYPNGTGPLAASYRNVLVALDPYGPKTILDRAVAVGLRDGARLTLLSVVPTPSFWVWLAPLVPYDLRRVLEADCERSLRAAAGGIPRSLSVVSLLRRGSLEGALLSELRGGRHDLVIVGAPRRRRLPIAGGHSGVWRFLRRSPVPVLVVSHEPDGQPTRPSANSARVELIAHRV